MALELYVSSLEGLPESISGLYERQADGRFALSVNGLEDTSGLKRKNEELLSEKSKMKDLLAVWDGIDPEEAKKALAAQRELEEAKLFDGKNGSPKEAFEKYLGERTQAMRSDFDNQRKRWEEEKAQLTEQHQSLLADHNKSVIEGLIISASSKAGTLRKEAIQDILARGLATFRLDEHRQPRAYKSDGSIMYGKNSNDPLSVDEWVTNMIEVAPHWWVPSTGGGAKGSVSSNGRKYSADELNNMSPSAKMKLGRDMEQQARR